MRRESVPGAESAGSDIKVGMGAAARPAPRSSVRSTGWQAQAIRVRRESGFGGAAIEVAATRHG